MKVGRRRVGVHHADPLAELGRLAFESEQARRDGADLLEREGQRAALAATLADGIGGTGASASQ